MCNHHKLGRQLSLSIFSADQSPANSKLAEQERCARQKVLHGFPNPICTRYKVHWYQEKRPRYFHKIYIPSLLHTPTISRSTNVQPRDIITKNKYSMKAKVALNRYRGSACKNRSFCKCSVVALQLTILRWCPLPTIQPPLTLSLSTYCNHKFLYIKSRLYSYRLE